MALLLCGSRQLSAADEYPAADAEFPANLSEITVVGSTPLPGSDLNREQIPESTRILGARDINRTGIPSLSSALSSNVASVTINDTEGNAFQPDLLFRGFTASPVAGTPQGLAIYVNGARFNDAFGDTVNWDLIPPAAIQSVNLEAANPIFGLNALGGSLNVRLKDGFTEHTASLTGYGGSYHRGGGILEYGQQYGDVAVYATADATHDGGFRQTSSSNLYRLFVDLGWRGVAGEVHINATGVHDTLGNPGATPVQSLLVDASSIFTAPNEVDNTYGSFNLHGNLKLNESTAFQGVAYYQLLSQVVPNGITEEVAPCNDGTGLLCNSDGSVVTGRNGQPVSDFLNGATYSGLSVQQLNVHAYGFSGEITSRQTLAARPNFAVIGASIDGSKSLFAGVQELGGFDPQSREFLGPGVVQDQPDAGINPVRVRSDTRFYGFFGSDTLSPLPNLDVTVGARYNDAQIVLQDELGGPVTGRHSFRRLNPSAGFTVRASSSVALYGSYSQTNRAPTPQELSCASPAYPCSLLNFFVGDPDLRQVIARSFELGIRGGSGEAQPLRFRWNLDAYRTDSTDDIIYETTIQNPNLAFYTNAGHTRRQGVEANVSADVARAHVKLGYAFTDATFQTAVVLNSSNNPAADLNGQEQVVNGDRIPGIPRHRGTVVFDFDVLDSLSLGAGAVTQSGAYRFGDEANLTTPLGGYTVVDLNAKFRAGSHCTFFAVVNNALNKRFYTYGAFGPVADVPWPSVPGGVNDARTASPGAPITAYGGVRIDF
jgi:outer membrane receptor protein involved in Fe transport